MTVQTKSKGLGPNRCDEKQLDLIRKCIEKEDATEWNRWRENNPDTAIWLQGAKLSSVGKRALLRSINLNGANLSRAKLPGAVLVQADLRNAVLVGTDLRRSILVNANMHGAQMLESDLRGSNLRESDLRNTQCAYSKVDEETMLLTDKISRSTDFTGVALESIRVDPGLKQLLQYNTRRQRWESWYADHPVLAPITRLFWLMCDYGRSTWRIVITFTLLVVLFALMYTLFPSSLTAVWASGQNPTFSFGYSLYFSIVTMTTLGFGDVYAAPNSALGQILLSSQVILGYILLGALITRFAVLFTAGGPSAPFYRDD